MRVLKLREIDNSVFVSGINKFGINIDDICFDKVYLAAGAVESFRILATSGLVDSKAQLKDSATFFLPLLASRRLGHVDSNSFALSQMFIKILDFFDSSSNQFQLYEYSEDLLTRARDVNIFVRILPKIILRFMLRKMLIAIGYLDGDRSPSINMQLLDDGSVDLSLNKYGVTLNERKKYIKRSVRNLIKEVLPLGLWPISILKVDSKPGEGVHSGGWLRMGKESNLLGVPIGCANIHVVDSSVLPTIAAGPITFTVMANAMRIVSESQK